MPTGPYFFMNFKIRLLPAKHTFASDSVPMSRLVSVQLSKVLTNYFNTFSIEEAIEPVWSRCTRTPDELNRVALGLAQRALLSGRPEIVGGIRTLLPPAGLDATDASGMTVLMKAALAGDDQIVTVSINFYNI